MPLHSVIPVHVPIVHVPIVHGPFPISVVHLPAPDAAAWVGAAAAALLFVVTGALAVFTFKLWRSTSALVRDAADTAKRELRAYVTVETIRIQTVMADTGILGTMLIMNYGRTPAYKLSVACDLTVDLRIGAPLPLPAASPALGPLAPGAHFGTTKAALFRLTATQFNQLQGGTHRLFFHGEIRYMDAFGVPRFTRFRVESDGANTTTSPEGNYTDDDALIDRQQQQ